MSKVLVPRNSRFFSTPLSRIKNRQTISSHPPEDFKKYTDWFYFTHIDPVQRYIHAFGMVAGYVIYFFGAYLLFTETQYAFTVIVFLTGVFFYYVLGIISHFIYDGGQGKTTPSHYLDTLFIVHKFNLQTIFGTYDQGLRDFVKKYPFVRSSFELIEIDRKHLFKYLYNNQEKQGGPIERNC